MQRGLVTPVMNKTCCCCPGPKGRSDAAEGASDGVRFTAFPVCPTSAKTAARRDWSSRRPRAGVGLGRPALASPGCGTGAEAPGGAAGAAPASAPSAERGYRAGRAGPGGAPGGRGSRQPGGGARSRSRCRAGACVRGAGGAAARALRRGAALAAAPAPLLGSERAVTADTQPAGAGSAAPAAGMNPRRPALPAAGTEAAVLPRYGPCAGRAPAPNRCRVFPPLPPAASAARPCGAGVRRGPARGAPC